MNYVRPHGNASSGNVQIIGGNDSALREFLVYHIGTMSLDDAEVAIYIGQLPTVESPVEIPFPTEARVIGSIIHKDRTEIYLISGSTPEAFLASYEPLLTANGWKFVDEIGYTVRAGFVDKPELPSRVYCLEAVKIALTVGLSKTEKGTSIRLLANRQSNPCVSISQMIAAHHAAYHNKIVPELQKPHGTTLIGGGTGGGTHSTGTYWASSAKLIAKLSTREITEHYHNQLDILGWEKHDETISDKSAQSSWLFSQEDSLWSAYFILSANPNGNNEYMLWLNLYEQEQ